MTTPLSITIRRALSASLWLLLGSVLLLGGCENAAYTECKDQASQLWDNNKNADNKAYWAAVNECKEKYGQ